MIGQVFVFYTFLSVGFLVRKEKKKKQYTNTATIAETLVQCAPRGNSIYIEYTLQAKTLMLNVLYVAPMLKV